LADQLQSCQAEQRQLDPGWVGAPDQRIYIGFIGVVAFCLLITRVLPNGILPSDTLEAEDVLFQTHLLGRTVLWGGSLAAISCGVFLDT